MAQYDYTKTTIDIETLSQEILDDGTILKTLDYVNWKAADNLSVFFTSALDTGEQTALQTLVTAHTGYLMPRVTVDQVVSKMEKMNQVLSSFMILNYDSFIDDYLDSSGVVTGSSSNYTVHKDGFVHVEKGQSNATIVTEVLTIETSFSTLKVYQYMFEGTGTFYASSDDGSTWTQITTFEQDVAFTAGTDWRMKIELSGTDKLGLISFQVF